MIHEIQHLAAALDAMKWALIALAVVVILGAWLADARARSLEEQLGELREILQAIADDESLQDLVAIADQVRREVSDDEVEAAFDQLRSS